MPPETAERELLSLLLDAYERSSFFKKSNPGDLPLRRIRLRLYDSGATDYPRYNIENAEVRNEVNRAVLSLAEKGLVSIRWMKGEVHHIVAQVSLTIHNTDSADSTGGADTTGNADGSGGLAAAYAFLGRKPKNTLACEAGAEVEALLAETESPWIRRFLEDCRDSLVKNRSISGPSAGGKSAGRLPVDGAERENLFRALRFIDTRRKREELLERVFSAHCFGDSKTFETSVKKRLLGIIRQYAGFEDGGTDEELLAFAGIVRYPEQFAFRGPLTLHLDPSGGSGNIDFSPLRHGASLCSLDFMRGRVELPVRLDRILSIENKANYADYIRRNSGDTELVVYHGGQFSPSRGAFFRALARAMPQHCAWHHFGDIDYGGFSMLARLRREIHPAVRPYRMDERELAAYAAFTLPISPSYADKLKALAMHEELADCRPCLTFMEQNRVRLEQEALLSPYGGENGA
jgi:hypothetical protein